METSAQCRRGASRPSPSRMVRVGASRSSRGRVSLTPPVFLHTGGKTAQAKVMDAYVFDPQLNNRE